MKTWGIYLMGVVTGAAILLAVVRSSPRAEAASPPLPRVAAGADNVGGVLLAAVGGSEANRDDILWVVYKRPLTAEETDKLPGHPQDHISITAYRAPAGGGGPVSLNLRAARNATLDFELDELIGGNMSVQDVIEHFRKR